MGGGCGGCCHGCASLTPGLPRCSPPERGTVNLGVLQHACGCACALLWVQMRPRKHESDRLRVHGFHSLLAKVLGLCCQCSTLDSIDVFVVRVTAVL